LAVYLSLGAKGIADRLDFKYFNSSNVNTVCDIECRDEGMLSNLDGFIKAREDKDILIVLHSIGSHGQLTISATRRLSKFLHPFAKPIN
jgi:glucan phosphoethanolaminetransferase (alkaline phosphatase superfamily)